MSGQYIIVTQGITGLEGPQGITGPQGLPGPALLQGAYMSDISNGPFVLSTTSHLQYSTAVSTVNTMMTGSSITFMTSGLYLISVSCNGYITTPPSYAGPNQVQVGVQYTIADATQTINPLILTQDVYIDLTLTSSLVPPGSDISLSGTVLYNATLGDVLFCFIGPTSQHSSILQLATVNNATTIVIVIKI
jgi:hypothetical protein